MWFLVFLSFTGCLPSSAPYQLHSKASEYDQDIEFIDKKEAHTICNYFNRVINCFDRAFTQKRTNLCKAEMNQLQKYFTAIYKRHNVRTSDIYDQRNHPLFRRFEEESEQCLLVSGQVEMNGCISNLFKDLMKTFRYKGAGCRDDSNSQIDLFDSFSNLSAHTCYTLDSLKSCIERKPKEMDSVEYCVDDTSKESRRANSTIIEFCDEWYDTRTEQETVDCIIYHLDKWYMIDCFKM